MVLCRRCHAARHGYGFVHENGREVRKKFSKRKRQRLRRKKKKAAAKLAKRFDRLASREAKFTCNWNSSSAYKPRDYQ